jgi:hypothetical protein
MHGNKILISLDVILKLGWPCPARWDISRGIELEWPLGKLCLSVKEGKTYLACISLSFTLCFCPFSCLQHAHAACHLSSLKLKAKYWGWWDNKTKWTSGSHYGIIGPMAWSYPVLPLSGPVLFYEEENKPVIFLVNVLLGFLFCEVRSKTDKPSAIQQILRLSNVHEIVIISACGRCKDSKNVHEDMWSSSLEIHS